MTEVEKILSSATACTPIFSIVLSGFQQWRHMHFLFHQLAHGNKFVPACSCSLKTSSSCSSRSKSDVSFLALLPPLGPHRFAHLDFVVHLLLLLKHTRKGQVIHPKPKRSSSQNPNCSSTSLKNKVKRNWNWNLTLNMKPFTEIDIRYISRDTFKNKFLAAITTI